MKHEVGNYLVLHFFYFFFFDIEAVQEKRKSPEGVYCKKVVGKAVKNTKAKAK